MAVRAKFNCISKTPDAEVGQVSFAAVFESKEGVEGNACPENAVFGKWTPSASLSMSIQNPAAFAQFEQGKAYYVDFTPAE